MPTALELHLRLFVNIPSQPPIDTTLQRRHIAYGNKRPNDKDTTRDFQDGQSPPRQVLILLDFIDFSFYFHDDDEGLFFLCLETAARTERAMASWPS